MIRFFCDLSKQRNVQKGIVGHMTQETLNAYRNYIGK